MSMSTDYFLKEDLKMEPAAAQAIKTLIHLPWNIKPVRYTLIVLMMMDETPRLLDFHFSCLHTHAHPPPPPHTHSCTA